MIDFIDKKCCFFFFFFFFFLGNEKVDTEEARGGNSEEFSCHVTRTG